MAQRRRGRRDGAGRGLDLDTVADSLADAVPASRWRMELTERPDGLVVVNDAYNANPESMRAALETLAGIGDRTGRRTVAVLGEMLELGDGRRRRPPGGRRLRRRAPGSTCCSPSATAADGIARGLRRRRRRGSDHHHGGA